MNNFNSLKKTFRFFMAAILALMEIGCEDKILENENSISESLVAVEETETLENETSESAPVGANSYASVFSNRDLNPNFDNITTEIALNGKSAECDNNNSGVTIDGSDITITQEGTYKISGSLNEGQIIVNAPDSKVQIILDNADITCKTSSAIYGVNSEKIFISLAENSVNNLSDGESYNYDDEESKKPDACIYSNDSLTINGTGTLNITSNLNGIHSTDDVVITGGNINITSVEVGIKAKDYVAVADGNINITSNADAIKSTSTKDESLGFIYIQDGEFVINSDLDGIYATTDLVIADGKFEIITGGGSENSVKIHTDDIDFGGGGFNHNDFAPEDMEKIEMPENFDPKDFEDIEMPEGFDPKNFEGMEMPEDFNPQNFEDMEMSEGFDPKNFEDMEMSEGFDPTNFENMEMPEDFDPKNFENRKIPENVDPTDMQNITPPDMTRNQTDTNSSESTISTKGLKSGTSINITDGEFIINSADDTLHSNGDISINGGNFTLATADDGVHVDNELTINGGTIDITESYEGLEGTIININDGDIKIIASDDAFNATNGTQSQFGVGTEGVTLNINGGSIYIDTTGDGLDSNNDLIITGGTIIVDGPTSGADSALDADGEIIVTGGLIIAVGSSQMAEYPGDSSTQYSVSATFDSLQKASTNIKLIDEGDNEIINFTSAKSFDNIVISSPDIIKDKTYTFYLDDTESESFTASDIISFVGKQSMMGGGVSHGRQGNRGMDGSMGDFQPTTNENGEIEIPNKNDKNFH